MNLAEIYTMSRLNTGVTSTNMPDATLLTLTNVTYRDLINTIVSRVNEDFFYNELLTSSVAGQSEYTFPIRDATTDWFKKLISVWIKYLWTEEYFTQLSPTKFSNLVRDPSYYLENQPSSDPFFTVADKSYFIFPAPTVSVTNWIKLYWIVDPKELQAGDTEDLIKIPVDFHHIIVLGNEYKIYKTRQLQDDANRAYNEYVAEVNKMCTQLSDRIVRPLESAMPYLTNLE